MDMHNRARQFWNWLTLADYYEAKERSTDEIIARYSRGNVNFQNGSILDEKEFAALSAAGDAAVASLQKHLSAA